MNWMTIDLSPLQVTSYRRVLMARTISIFGLGMVMVAIPVQIQQLTGSPVFVGVVAGLEGLAAFSGMLLGGGVIDRYDRRLVIIYSRMVGLLCFAILSINALVDTTGTTIKLGIITTVAITDGFAGSFAAAALVAITGVLLPKEKMASAGMLNIATIRIGTIFAPLVAGFIIAQSSIVWCYVIGLLLAAITIMVLIGLPSLKPAQVERGEGRLIDDPSIWYGVQSIVNNKLLLLVMLIAVGSSLVGGVRVLFPALVDEQFHGQAQLVGLMFSAVPAGALVAAIFSGWLGKLKRSQEALIVMAVFSFFFLGLFGLTCYFSFSWTWLGLGFLVCFGCLSSWADVLQFAILQQETPDCLRGRVSGVWLAQEISAESVGSFGAGWIGKIWGASLGIVILAVSASGLSVPAISKLFGARCLYFLRRNR